MKLSVLKSNYKMIYTNIHFPYKTFMLQVSDGISLGSYIVRLTSL